MRNIDKKLELNGSYVSYRHLASYHMPMHEHDTLQILIPLEGSCYDIAWVLEDMTTESKPLGVCDICIIPPYLKHEVRWSNIAHFISLYITPHYIQEHIESSFDVQNNIIEEHIGFNDQTLYQLAQSMSRYFSQAKTINYKYLNAILTVVSQHIITNYLKCEGDDQLQHDDFSQIPCVKIRQAVMFIQNNLNNSLSVEEIADSVGMSYYHFIRTFKDNMGVSPAKFHMLQRIEKAKEMLNCGEKIIDVAIELGFSNQAHFSNAFVKFVGITPGKFTGYQ
jgi:AraC family transcriptional regulator